MAGKFEIKKSKNDQFYFVLKAANHEVVLTSETYTTKQNAQKGIQAIQTSATGAQIEDLT